MQQQGLDLVDIIQKGAIATYPLIHGWGAIPQRFFLIIILGSRRPDYSLFF